MSEVLRLLTKDDLEQAFELDQDVFNGDRRHRAAFDALGPPERIHGVFENGRLLAMSRVVEFGQYFGGRRVPMGGLSSVAVAPDARGRGVAKRVVHASLVAMRERGECISSLFPATTSLYRSLGWELAGAFVIYRLQALALRTLGPPVAGRVRRAERTDTPAIKALYARLARDTPGFLDRARGSWHYLDALWDDFSVFVAVDARGAIDGYLAYRQLPKQAGGFGFVVQVRDVFAASRAAFLALFSLLGSMSTQAETIEYKSSPEDPLSLLLDVQRQVVHGDVRWMLRIVEPCAAIAARGYAPGLDAGVEFTLDEAPACARDEVFAANAGAYRLDVSKGEGRLMRVGSAPSLRLGVGAFASLYSGWAQTATLDRLGLLSGGSASERAALDAAFAGPTPWLPEEF